MGRISNSKNESQIGFFGLMIWLPAIAALFAMTYEVGRVRFQNELLQEALVKTKIEKVVAKITKSATKKKGRATRMIASKSSVQQGSARPMEEGQLPKVTKKSFRNEPVVLRSQPISIEVAGSQF